MRAMRALRTVGWMLPLLTASCMVQIDSCGASFSSSLGHSVSSRNGHLVVDGVDLQYERWVDVQLDTTGADPLVMETCSGPIELTGKDGDPSGACALSVHVHSQLADDGEVYLGAGTLSVRSQHGGKVFIDGVRGTVPVGLALKLGSVSGDIRVEGASKGRTLLIDTTSGDVVVEGSEPSSIRVDSTSGKLRLEQSSSASLVADTTSGDVTVVGGAWGAIRLDSTSSDLRLQGCTADEVKLDSTSGDLEISGGHCKRARLDSISGDIDLRDGAKVDQLSED